MKGLFRILAAAAVLASLLPAVRAGHLDVPALQQRLTNGAPESVADLLGAEAERDPRDVRLAYNHGVASYAARRWEDALVAFDRVEMSGDRRLAPRASFQKGNAEYRLGVEAMGANLDETVARWKAAIEAYGAVLRVRPDDPPARTNDAFVRARLTALLLRDARASLARADRPGQSDAQKIPPLRDAFEKFGEARETSPGDTDAREGEDAARERLAESLKQEGLRNARAPLGLRPNRREPRLPDVDTSKLEEGLSQLEESDQVRPGDPEVAAAIEQARRRLADARVKQAETFLALEEQVPITKEKLALLRMGREQVDKALEQAPDHAEAREVGREIDRRMARVHEDEGDLQEHQAQFSNLEQQAMQLGQALDHFQQAGELRPDDPALDAKQDRVGQKLADALDKLADKLMQSPGDKESMESKAARLEGAEQALNELQSMRPSERTSQRAEQVGRELDGLRQMLAEKGRQPSDQPGKGEPDRMAQGLPQPQWMGPPMDGPPRILQPGAKGAAPRNAGRNPRDY